MHPKLSRIRDRIEWESPLLLCKVAAHSVRLSLPVVYPQGEIGKRELISEVCLYTTFHPECPNHVGFTIFEDATYHCFGCCMHGSVLSLLRQYHGLGFYEAIGYCIRHPDFGKPLPECLTQEFITTVFDPLIGTPL